MTAVRDLGQRAWDTTTTTLRDWAAVNKARRRANALVRSADTSEAVLVYGRLVREVQQARESLRSYDQIAGWLDAGATPPDGLELPKDLPETLLLFVGYSRSGHSLVGSLLDAHPNAIISHELHAAKHLAAGASLVRVQRAIALNAFFFHYFGRGYSGYDYQVPGQMQGRCRRLQVLGDKKANGTTRLLRSDPNFALRLRESVGVPVRFMHVIRNPFDNITTKARRTHTSLKFAADVYFRHVEAVEALRRTEGDRVIDVYLDELTEDPRAVMGSLVETLGLSDTPQDYLDACAARVFSKSRRTSSAGDWSESLLRDVRARLRDCEFLARFADEPIAT